MTFQNALCKHITVKMSYQYLVRFFLSLHTGSINIKEE